MNTGKLNKRITLNFTGTMTGTDTGGFSEGAATTTEVWGSAKKLSMREELLYGLETSNASYSFKFRYYSVADLENIDSVTYNDKEFRIKSIIDKDDDKKEVEVIASERI